MVASFVLLPPELIDPIVSLLTGSELCSIRLSCQYLCKASNKAFLRHISKNRYFTLEHSLGTLEQISHHADFRSIVDILRIYPHSLTWTSEKPFPALAREEVDYARWLTHPLSNLQRGNFRRWLIYHYQFKSSCEDSDILSNALVRLPRLSTIEVGAWGSSISAVERGSKTMQVFREETNLEMLHFDWQTIAGARSRSTRATCDGECSLTEDFKLVLLALAKAQTPLTVLKAHYWSDLGLKCIQIQDVSFPFRALAHVFSYLRVLHLCIGFERGRRSSDETGSLANTKTWLADLLNTTPLLEDLKLVFDGWAQWEMRPDVDAPDWSGSLFHHLADRTIGFAKLRKLDLQNMFVRWQDVSHFLQLHKQSIEELSLNCMTIWSVISWTQPTPDSDTSSWLYCFKEFLGSMSALRSVNLSWLCINGRMMCFHQENLQHCSGCDNKITSKPTDYGIRACPHYAFGRNRDVTFLRNPTARKICGPNTDLVKDFLVLPVVMVPMHAAFPLYYQADENNHEAQWQYYDGTFGRWETSGPDAEVLLGTDGVLFT
ncbi:hypothetical protein BDV97DRAFT_373428 [Delphinella strobiligena]|nr:hypothetical protein BDV97DRAFT_373428 [Delphinella strobiligena]